jgi:uncharacterized protein GlcG (DUF336 family)
MKCSALPAESQLQQLLQNAAQTGKYGPVGGLFEGERMWAAVVNRDGEVCAFNTSTADTSQVWPGSQAIAKSKAYTANAFSLDDFALSTARLYTFTQPGHSLWSLGLSNPFNPGHWRRRANMRSNGLGLLAVSSFLVVGCHCTGMARSSAALA